MLDYSAAQSVLSYDEQLCLHRSDRGVHVRPLFQQSALAAPSILPYQHRTPDEYRLLTEVLPRADI